MKLKNHIGMVRTILKEYSDDTIYTDEFLANLLNSARASIYEERLKAKKIMSRFNFNSFCIKLCLDTFFDCSCVPESVQCQVLKSDIEIPRVILDNRKDLLKVYTLTGIEIPYKHYTERKRFNYNSLLK